MKTQINLTTSFCDLDRFASSADLIELLEDEGQKLKFVFDYMTERYFYMKLKETVPGKHLHDPLCSRKEGKAPKEDVGVEEVVVAPKIIEANIEELGEEFYGDEEFNEEELEELSDEFEEESID